MINEAPGGLSFPDDVCPDCLAVIFALVAELSALTFDITSTLSRNDSVEWGEIRARLGELVLVSEELRNHKDDRAHAVEE